MQSIRHCGHFRPFRPYENGKLCVSNGMKGSTPAASTNILKTLQDAHSNRAIEPGMAYCGASPDLAESPRRCYLSIPVTTPPCKRKNPAYRGCKCPKWIQGTLDSGEFIRRSAKTRSWAKAQKRQMRSRIPIRPKQLSVPIRSFENPSQTLIDAPSQSIPPGKATLFVGLTA